MVFFFSWWKILVLRVCHVLLLSTYHSFSFSSWLKILKSFFQWLTLICNLLWLILNFYLFIFYLEYVSFYFIFLFTSYHGHVCFTWNCAGVTVNINFHGNCCTFQTDLGSLYYNELKYMQWIIFRTVNMIFTVELTEQPKQYQFFSVFFLFFLVTCLLPF